MKLTPFIAIRDTLTSRLDQNLELLAREDLDPTLRETIENRTFETLNMLGKYVETDKRADRLFDTYLNRYATYRGGRTP